MNSPPVSVLTLLANSSKPPMEAVLGHNVARWV
jgi:hypothetical protein